MGTISHNAMVITASAFDPDYDHGHGHNYPAKLVAFCAENDIKLYGPFAAKMNGYETYLVPPDGSKEGWSTSNEGDTKRKALAAWMRAPENQDGYFDWVDVRYGELGAAVEDSE